MPEIAEVRVVRDVLRKQIIGKRITDIKVFYSGIIEGSTLQFQNKLQNMIFTDVKSYGKWLIFELGDISFLSHLRMEGKYFYVPSNVPYKKHEHVVFVLDNGMDLRYEDVRKFGKMELVRTLDVENAPSIRKLGPEPSSEKLTPLYLQSKLYNKKLPIKTMLLDQTVINGLGNIYVNEVLYASKIHPLRDSGSISLKEADEIIQNSRRITEKAYEMGGTTIKSYTSSLGVIGQYQNELKVQSRENKPCFECGTLIERIQIGGRSSFFCPKCQK